MPLASLLALAPLSLAAGPLAARGGIVALNDVAQVCAGSSVSIPVSANDTTSTGSIDCSALAVVSPPTQGSVSIQGCSIVYTSTGGFSGFDTFVYRTCNDRTPPDCALAQVTVTACEVIAQGDWLSMVQGTPRTFLVAGNDSTTCGTLDCSSVTVVTPPLLGIVSVQGCQMTYTPLAGGIDFIEYSISNSLVPACSDTAVVRIEVDPGPFCDAADGTLDACACGSGSPLSGCELAEGTGGVRLSLVQQVGFPMNRATLEGSGFPARSNPSVVVLRSSTLDPASPIVFGDGLRCIGLPVTRMAGTLASGGASQQVIGHSAGAGQGAFYYQLWFRNTPASFCDPTAAFNLSNGRGLIW